MASMGKENVFQKFIEKSPFTLHQFSKASGIHYSSLYGIYVGKTKPRLRLIKRICRASNGTLTLKDFGYDAENI